MYDHIQIAVERTMTVYKLGKYNITKSDSSSTNEEFKSAI